MKLTHRWEKWSLKSFNCIRRRGTEESFRRRKFTLGRASLNCRGHLQGEDRSLPSTRHERANFNYHASSTAKGFNTRPSSAPAYVREPSNIYRHLLGIPSARILPLREVLRTLRLLLVIVPAFDLIAWHSPLQQRVCHCKSILLAASTSSIRYKASSGCYLAIATVGPCRHHV